MRALVCTALLSITAAACGASYPAPTQRMADAMSAERSAEEVGAASNPQAQLHLKLAQEQIAKAKTLMANDENRRAELTLARAKSDAELALALARAMNAKAEAQQAIGKSNSVQTQNMQDIVNATSPIKSNQGAPQ